MQTLFKKEMWLVIVPLALLITGCGETPAEKEFSIKVKSSMEKGDPANIRKEVSMMLSNTNANTADLDKQIPKDIASLRVFTDDGAEIMVWAVPAKQDGAERGLYFVTGSGFGHWGIVVFPFGDGETLVKHLYGKTTPWKEGIYFWIEE